MTPEGWLQEKRDVILRSSISPEADFLSFELLNIIERLLEMIPHKPRCGALEPHVLDELFSHKCDCNRSEQIMKAIGGE
jgi:hypothetical protein